MPDSTPKAFSSDAYYPMTTTFELPTWGRGHNMGPFATRQGRVSK